MGKVAARRPNGTTLTKLANKIGGLKVLSHKSLRLMYDRVIFLVLGFISKGSMYSVVRIQDI